MDFGQDFDVAAGQDVYWRAVVDLGSLGVHRHWLLASLFVAAGEYTPGPLSPRHEGAVRRFQDLLRQAVGDVSS